MVVVVAFFAGIGVFFAGLGALLAGVAALKRAQIQERRTEG